MRVLCLLLFCLSAAAAIRLGYKRGYRYSYKYVGWLAHGITEAFEKDLAVKISAKAHLDYLRSRHERLTLQDVKLVKVVDKILYNDRVEVEMGEEQSIDDVNEKLKECLESPITFEFRQGKVEEEINSEKGVREWCLNIQRAIVNQLYLPIKDNNERYQLRKNEVTHLGTCDTSYTITAEKPYYKVKRAINLTMCTAKPEVSQISLPNTDAFHKKRTGRGTAEELPILVRTEAYMHYDLEGSESAGFLIREVVCENIKEVTLSGDLQGSGKVVAAHTKQFLKLYAKEQPIPSESRQIRNEEKRSGLMCVLDQDTSEIESNEGQENVLRQVRVHMNTIEQQMKSGSIEPETALEFTRLVSRLRDCTVETLNKVVDDIFHCQDKNTRRVYFDAMARVGTEPAGKVLFNLVDSGRVNDELRRIAFGLGWVRGLHTAFMKQVLKICEHQTVNANFKAHRDCWLSFGTLLNRLMQKIRDEPRMTQDMRVTKFKNDVAKILRQAMQQTEKQDEQLITFLKTVGNAGWITQDVFKVVCDILYNSTSPLHVKVQAIWAMRHMARVQPLQVRRKLMPFLANPVEDPELRISCYKILMQSDASLLTCQMIASVIARESAGRGPRSNQLISFIASDLRTSLQYDNIDIVKSSRARLLLRVIPRAITFQVFSYSKGLNYPLDAGNNLVAELRLSKINGPQSFIPRHMHAKVKMNMPGVSADLVEFGMRMQGIHDLILPFLGPKGNRQKRSIDILRYLFGATTERPPRDDQKKVDIGEKLPPRWESYYKLYGSETSNRHISENDLLEIIKDGLFGQKTTKEGHCTFTANEIKCNMPFTRAHIVNEKRYLTPTLIGIPYKYTSTYSAVAKGSTDFSVSGEPKLMTSKFDEIKANVNLKPTISAHMHIRAGACLPIFETGVTLRQEVYTSPNIDFCLTVTKNGFKLDAPISSSDQRWLETKPAIQGFMRKELTAGDAQWFDIDLELRDRGWIQVPHDICYAEKFINLKVCYNGRLVDREYLRLKRLPVFPYACLTKVNVLLKKDDINTPVKFKANYHYTQNNQDKYQGYGEARIVSKVKDMYASVKPNCNRKMCACDVKWEQQSKKCPDKCAANTTIDYSREDRLNINTEYDANGEMSNEFLVENEGQRLRIINTWSKLPEWVKDYLLTKRPSWIAYLHRFFGIRGHDGTEHRAEMTFELLNKFYMDIFVETPTMKLRRINQGLAIPMESFRPKTTFEKIKKYYGACLAKGTKYFETTDNVVISEDLPGTCPFVLAEDARSDSPDWKILLRKVEGGRQVLVIEVDGNRIEFNQDKTVYVNGKVLNVGPDANEVADVGQIMMVKSQLYFKCEYGFECLFDGSTTVVLFSPWLHNRVQGICGNNDGEQWSDLKTRQKTYMPEWMKKEFLREWIVEGQACGDKDCKLQPKHVKLESGAPKDKICLTNGRYLRCKYPDRCKPNKGQSFEKVAYHCFDPQTDQNTIEKIKAGEASVSLETMSVDVIRPVEEHTACDCDC